MNIMELRTKHGGLMTPEQQQHIEGVIERFAERVYAKYAAGQLEHGGDLWKKDIVLEELINETLDFVVYADTLKMQIELLGLPLGQSLPD